MGTLGFGAMSFYRSEANKIMLFKKYEKQVNMYMKWRTEREVRDYLRKGVIDENWYVFKMIVYWCSWLIDDNKYVN